MCDLLVLFYLIIITLLELKGPSIHQVFDIYNTLFNYIEYSLNKL